jgi:hypothetical protein
MKTLRGLAQAVVDASGRGTVGPADYAAKRAFCAAANCAYDDAGQVAGWLLTALDAAYAQGYARAMGEVVAEVQTRTEAAVSSYYADRSSYREGYSDACDTLCELVQHMAQTRCD